MESDQQAEQITRLDRDALLDALATGAAVLTANARLARHLSAEFERLMLAGGREAWATPKVLPLDAWLMDTYEQHQMAAVAPPRRVMTPEQEQQLWATIIRREGPGLLRVDAAANRARSSWKRVCDWRLDLADRRFADNENGRAFRRWAIRFRSACDSNHWVSESGLCGLLTPLIAHGECPVPDRVLLAGFFDPAPAQRGLVIALREAGCAAEWVEFCGEPGRVRRVGAADGPGEIALAAEWARQILLEQPRARIGIVVPDLAARRASLEHGLRTILDPASLLPGARERAQPWNLSLGAPLSRSALIRTALGLLSLVQSPVDVAALGPLLGSPHWGLAQDADERRADLGRRAVLDRRLRSIGDAAMPLASIRYEAGQTDESGTPRPWACPLLARRLDSLLEAHRQLPGRLRAGGWARTFARWLALAGWPQGRPLDSREFQALDAWNVLLSRFSALDDFAGNLTRGEALALLGRLADERLFQPRTEEAPVQVLGLYEANSLQFDHLWVMGLQDTAWPPSPSPDPFLPLAMQREEGMPHCTPESEWARAADVTSRLAGAAPDVMFSWPCREGDEAFACSPLIGHVPEVRANESVAELAGLWFRRIRNAAEREPAPPPSPIELRQVGVPGGTRVYAHQAACPFRAFAEHRLGALPLERPGVGLGARRAGALLHRALELFWRTLQTQAALVSLDPQELSSRVEAAVGEALEAQRRRSPVTLAPRYMVLEAKRLHQRIMDWLEQERARSPFRVVGLEQHRAFETRGVRVKLFIDRIDELADGSRVVIDYKTGRVRPSGWFGERPDDPQLPLYGVASDDAQNGHPLAAAAVAQIRPDRAGFSGVVRDAGILPGLPASRPRPLVEAAESWPSVLEEWSAVLNGLADAFRAGRAEVDPRNGLNTCQQGYCELAPLCRVRERLPAPGEVGEDADSHAWNVSGTPGEVPDD